MQGCSCEAIVQKTILDPETRDSVVSEQTERCSMLQKCLFGKLAADRASYYQTRQSADSAVCQDSPTVL